MAKDSQIRNIPLEAMCDLTNFQEVADYDGFRETNSLYLNKRLGSWWKQKTDGGYIAGNLTYQKAGGNFVIKDNGKEVMRISKNRYVLEEVSSYPNDAKKCANPYPLGSPYEWTEFWTGERYLTNEDFEDAFVFTCEYENDWAILATFPKGSAYTCRFFSWTGSRFNQIGEWDSDYKYVFFAHLKEDRQPVTKNVVGIEAGSGDDDDTEYVVGEKTFGQVVASGYYVTQYHKSPSDDLFNSATRNATPRVADITKPEGIGDTYKMHFENGAFVPDKSKNYANLNEDALFVYMSSSLLRVLRISETEFDWDDSAVNKIYSRLVSEARKQDGTINYDELRKEAREEYIRTMSDWEPPYDDILIYDNNSDYEYHDTFNSFYWEYDARNFGFEKCGEQSVAETKGSFETFVVFSGHWSKNKKCFVTSWLRYVGDIESVYFPKSDNTREFRSLRTIHPVNFSKLFGTFAINYVNNTEYTIGNAYKKIIQLDEHEDLRYTSDAMYFTLKNRKYKLCIRTSERPSFTVLDDDCVIFNTTTYNNAYNMTYGTVFCSSDDWNNRAQWKLTGEYSDRWALTNSRLNQNWQTQKKIVSTSTQFSSVTNRLAIRTEEKDGATLTYSDAAHMGVFFVDDSYKMPSDVTYDVFFEDYLGDNVGSLIKQGELKNGEFIVNKDEAYIFAEPASDGNQENVPILDCSFRDFNGVTLIQIGDFTYQAMKQTMLGNAFVPVYIVSESGYSATDYIQFVINGQLYTYYPTTNQIIDPNDQFVCDTSTLVYIGYSPKSAYFWSTMDKCVYTFNGDNTMSRLICAERLDLQLQPFKTSSAVLGDALNIPSLDLLVVNFKNKFAVLYDSQLCLIDAGGTIEPGTMSINKNDASIIVNDVSYSLIKRTGYAPVPVEIETKFFGDVSGKMNCINDAVYIDVVSFDKAGSGTVDIQAVALVNGSVKEGKKKTIAVRNADFNAVGVATIRYQSDIQECAGFKLKIKSDFSIASIRIGTDAGAMVQPLIKA